MSEILSRITTFECIEIFFLKLIEFILKLMFSSKSYPAIYRVFLWVGCGRENGAYI
jgi:hypothetical protein